MKVRRAAIGLGVMLVGVLVGVSGAPAAYAAKSAAKDTVKYIGNSDSKKYHKPSCDYAKKISKDNRVEFASAADAKKAGYKPCKVCLDKDKKDDSAKMTDSTAKADAETDAKKTTAKASP